MKHIAIISILGLTLLSVSCKKAPKFGGFGSHSEDGKTKTGGGSGSGEEPDPDEPDPFDPPTNTEKVRNACQEEEKFRGLRSLRRLSNTEFKNTVNELFPGVNGLDFSGLTTDTPSREAFDTIAVQPNFITDVRFRGYVKFAESLATKIDPAKVFGCYKDGKNCIQMSLNGVLTRLWRRPPTKAESDDLLATYTEFTKDGLNAEASTRLLIQAMVLSRGFVYRTELGEKGSDDVYTLTPWEVASALSYGLTRKAPDATLLSLAKDGSLKDGKVIEAQARRLLGDTANKQTWKEFSGMWLEAGRIMDRREQNPKYTAQVKKGLEDSLTNFFTGIFYNEKTFKQLLMAEATPSDPNADFTYGYKTENGQIKYKEPERRGLLGHANFLVSNALEDGPNPIKRGVFVLDRLLCISFAPPPKTTPPEFNAGKTNKERFANHSSGECKSCHVYIDQAGFAFEHFDQNGAFRTVDAGQPVVVDSKPTIDDEPMEFTSPEQLSEAIANSRQGRECFSRHAFRYTLGRMEHAPHAVVGGVLDSKFKEEGKLDACQISAMTDAMETKEGDMQEAVVSIFTNPAFLQRIEKK